MINLAGAGYRLTVTLPLLSLSTAMTGTFQVYVGPAVKVAFTTTIGPLDGSLKRNYVFGQMPVVSVQDAGGNLVVSDGPRTIVISMM